MLSRITGVEECDARDDDSKVDAGYQNITSLLISKPAQI